MCKYLYLSRSQIQKFRWIFYYKKQVKAFWNGQWYKCPGPVGSKYATMQYSINASLKRYKKLVPSWSWPVVTDGSWILQGLCRPHEFPSSALAKIAAIVLVVPMLGEECMGPGIPLLQLQSPEQEYYCRYQWLLWIMHVHVHVHQSLSQSYCDPFKAQQSCCKSVGNRCEWYYSAWAWKHQIRDREEIHSQSLLLVKGNSSV